MIKFLPYVFAAAAMTTAMVACSEKENTNGNGNGNLDELPSNVVSGSVTDVLTLKAGGEYKLDGELIVEAGATLNIEKGVKLTAIYDDKVDYILVKQGGKINAVGTKDEPIIMTSEKEEPGAWGGIHICGYAHTNAEGGKGSSEIGGASYGSNNDSDNSGTLKYIRLEYTGFAFDEEHEANGISFYGVGNGTTVEYCEAYMGSDDGFEFFGGSVNVSNLLAVNCSDDSFDWTEGWNGKAKSIVAYQQPEGTIGYDCDCLIEADNNENNFAATPVSHPELSDVLLVGNNGAKQGIRLRRGTEIKLDNAKVCGKAKCIAVESAETENALKSGKSAITNTKISSKLDSKEGIYTDELFKAANGNASETEMSYDVDKILKECTWLGGWSKF